MGVFGGPYDKENVILKFRVYSGVPLFRETIAYFLSMKLVVSWRRQQIW